jgi:hypothetical protein
MNIKNITQSQYLAALEMLKQTIEKCPDELWNKQSDKNKYWHVAYHVIFYAHLYLQPTEEDFHPWEKHREEYQFMGSVHWPPHHELKIGEPYTKEEVLEYLDFCKQQVVEIVPQLDMHAESGFSWLPFSKFELQFYNIRHLQQHTGELAERLGQAGIDINWVGMKSPEI